MLNIKETILSNLIAGSQITQICDLSPPIPGILSSGNNSIMKSQLGYFKTPRTCLSKP